MKNIISFCVVGCINFCIITLLYANCTNYRYGSKIGFRSVFKTSEENNSMSENVQFFTGGPFRVSDSKHAGFTGVQCNQQGVCVFCLVTAQPKVNHQRNENVTCGAVETSLPDGGFMCNYTTSVAHSKNFFIDVEVSGYTMDWYISDSQVICCENRTLLAGLEFDFDQVEIAPLLHYFKFNQQN